MEAVIGWFCQSNVVQMWAAVSLGEQSVTSQKTAAKETMENWPFQFSLQLIKARSPTMNVSNKFCVTIGILNVII